MSYTVHFSKDEIARILLRETLHRYNPRISGVVDTITSLSYYASITQSESDLTITGLQISVEIKSIDGKEL